jgi:hypothetical protein
MFYKLLFFFFKVKTSLCGCGGDIAFHDFAQGKKHYTIEKVSDLPAEINESSGLLSLNDTLLSMNDSGGKNEIYAFNGAGFLLKKQNIVGENIDWEALATDYKNDIFIGDFGNNANKRNDLTIYRCDKSNGKTIATIHFTYEDQKNFPPNRRQRHFDCEAMFFHNDSLYLFSKNRGKKTVFIYVVPAIEGHHVAKKIAQKHIKSQVTDAAINPSTTAFALLTYGRLLIFDIKKEKIDFSSPKYCLKTRRNQTEGIAYRNNDDLYFTNEQGSLFFVKAKKAKKIK